MEIRLKLEYCGRGNVLGDTNHDKKSACVGEEDMNWMGTGTDGVVPSCHHASSALHNFGSTCLPSRAC